MSIIDVLFGRPLASHEASQERVGVSRGVGLFGLDALSSAAYGPEAALTILIPLGVAGIHYVVPISASIIALLAIVYFSYRQTIAAYPGGGGSYTVARENLGDRAGLLGAAALMIDYVLNVCVGIAAGVGALVSAAPALQSHTLLLCLAILLVLTIVNLRGVREAGLIFLAPTYLFLFCLLGALAWGIGKTILSGGHPMPVTAPPHMPAALTTAGTWLIIKAFASGCTALTGVEAVSNGVQAFKEPVTETARRTLAVIIAALIMMLAGIAWLVRAYQIGATPPGQSGYQSILSMLLAAIAGRGLFYYIAMASILAVLSLSANTSFSDFPRVCHVVAQDAYLPYGFAIRGRRLVYSQGVVVLSLLSGLLLILFRGVTDRLIPLFAVGAFMAFTLSQAGMVAHWRKQTRNREARTGMLINAVGAAATGLTLLTIIVAKFVEGAWMTLLLIPILLALMAGIQRHYRLVQSEVTCYGPLEIRPLQQPLVVVPIDGWTRVAEKALRFGLTLSKEVRALHIAKEDEQEELMKQWNERVLEPARKNNQPAPELVVLPSPYRFVIAPILEHVLHLQNQNPQREIAVIVPELVEKHWYHYFLHNQRAEVLSALLTIKGGDRVVIINVPWQVNS